MQVGSPLTPEDRILLQEVFGAATAIVDEQERKSYLDGVCAGRPGLRQTVEALLASDEELQARTQPGEALPLFGEYRGIRVIGRGGMGVVWLAERADGEFEKQVAVKLLSGWALSPAARDHFRRERQILASLEHPGVVRILDGGVQADGSPYLVMEYVDGAHIDVYCERERLSAEERRRLFTQVLDAVSYAHSRRVIHRDIKPSNILVDATGRARLLDFGTARMVEPEGAAQSPQTVMRSFTPGYSCPELMSGKPVDARADIYSLGVLYGKLVGPVGSGVERRATAVEPKDRYADAMEMRQAVLASGSQTAALLGRWSICIGAVAALGLVATAYWAKPAAATVVLGLGVERGLAISADGGWVAFSRRGEQPGTSHLWLRPMNGKPAVQLTRDAVNDRYPSLGPRDEFVVFESDRQPAGIYRLRTSGGGAKPELLIAGGHVPKVSPDGKHLLYLLHPISAADAEAGAGGIAMMPLQGEGYRWRDEHLVAISEPVWAPDSKGVLAHAVRQPIRLDRDRRWQYIPLDGQYTPASLDEAWDAARTYPCAWLGNGEIMATWTLAQRAGLAMSSQPPLARGLKAVFESAGGFSGCLGAGNALWGESSGQTKRLLWIPLDGDTEEVRKGAALPSLDQLDQPAYPSVSGDGVWLSFLSQPPGSGWRQEIWNLRNRTRQYFISGEITGPPLISPDGLAVVAHTAEGRWALRWPSLEPLHHLQPLDGMFSWDISGRGEIVLVSSGPAASRDIAEFDTRRESLTTTLDHPDLNLYLADLSFDEQWIVFVAEGAGLEPRMFAAPYRRGQRTALREWVELGKGDYPKWSSSGRHVFYYDAAGLGAVRRLTVDEKTKLPQGSPELVYAMDREWTERDLNPGTFRLSVSRNGLMLNLGRRETRLTRLAMPGKKWWLW